MSKLAVAVEEADESVGWLEIIIRADLAGDRPLAALLREANEIVAILTASRRTAEQRGSRRPEPRRGTPTDSGTRC